MTRTKWRTYINSDSHVRLWGDEYLVYNPQSGSTHLLRLMAGQILQKLECSAMDVSGLSSLLATDWQQEVDAEFVQGVHGLLLELQELALVECA